jgi:hypothetical protein
MADKSKIPTVILERDSLNSPKKKIILNQGNTIPEDAIIITAPKKKKSRPWGTKAQGTPHSKLKTQKELKQITDSAVYKKSDYKKKTEMLGGKVYSSGGRAGLAGGGMSQRGLGRAFKKGGKA